MSKIQWQEINDGSLEISERLTYCNRLKTALKYAAEKECDQTHLSDRERAEVVVITQHLITEIENMKQQFKRSKPSSSKER